MLCHPNIYIYFKKNLYATHWGSQEAKSKLMGVTVWMASFTYILNMTEDLFLFCHCYKAAFQYLHIVKGLHDIVEMPCCYQMIQSYCK